VDRDGTDPVAALGTAADEHVRGLDVETRWPICGL